MKYSKVIGISAPEIGWVPSPGFILRRAAILEIVKKLIKGKVLEIGCGPGGILYELGRLDFQCTGVELSDKSRTISKKLLSEYPDVEMLKITDSIQRGVYDYLFSFEVLEHIKNDVEALSSWLEFLKDDGLVVLSVPAHRSKWNVTDLMAGHYRRYDRSDVENLLASTGLEIIKLETYGWPASWFLEKIRLYVKNYQLRKSGINVEMVEIGDVELTKQSGVERETESQFFKYYGSVLLGQPVFYLLTKFQKLFYKTNLGISYIVVAKKQCK